MTPDYNSALPEEYKHHNAMQEQIEVLQKANERLKDIYLTEKNNNTMLQSEITHLKEEKSNVFKKLLELYKETINTKI